LVNQPYIFITKLCTLNLLNVKFWESFFFFFPILRLNPGPHACSSSPLPPSYIHSSRNPLIRFFSSNYEIGSSINSI
jgi:hypothetical protein